VSPHIDDVQHQVWRQDMPHLQPSWLSLIYVYII